jgi:hypothetical protein
MRCWARGLAGRDLAEGLADCDESLRLRPGDGNTLNSRGLVQFKLGALDRAMADYDAAVRLNDSDAGSLYGRGVSKLKSGDTAGGNADIAAAKGNESRYRRSLYRLWHNCGFATNTLSVRRLRARRNALEDC